MTGPPSRSLHPIEQAILEHIDRYRLTTPVWSVNFKVKGMTDLVVAQQRLTALCRHGWLIEQNDLQLGRYFRRPYRDPTCATRRKPQGAKDHRFYPKAYSSGSIRSALVMLHFCNMQLTSRIKLTAQELRSEFPSLIRKGATHSYYIERRCNRPCLGFMRVDLGSKWNRIIEKISNDVRWHLRQPPIQELLAFSGFEVALALSPQSDRITIETVLAQKQHELAVPVRCFPTVF